MANTFHQAYSANTAAFNATDLYTCRVIVPASHKLVAATLRAQNIVTTGTVTVALRKITPGYGRGGGLVGTAFENDDLDDVSSVDTEIDFVLTDDDKLIAAAGTMYFLVMTATNSADRVDEPVLLIEVEEVSV